MGLCEMCYKFASIRHCYIKIVNSLWPGMNFVRFLAAQRFLFVPKLIFSGAVPQLLHTSASGGA